MRALPSSAPLVPPPDAGRRACLCAGSVLGLAALTGCACGRSWFPLEDIPRLASGALAPPPPRSGSLELPVVIDAHCHIFNVEDVPASAMLKGPIAHTLQNFLEELLIAFADLVAAIAYAVTPGVRAELALLEAFVAEHRAAARTQPGRERDVARDLLEKQRRKFLQAFAKEARNPRFLKPFLLQMQAYNLDNGRPVESFVMSDDSVEAILSGRTMRPRARHGTSGDARSLIPFACALTSPRFVNLIAMQEMYAGGPGVPAVDVFCPSTLDLDHWLGCPSTAASQHDQVLLTEQIAVVSGGAILPFVGYNPRTDVQQQGASLARVIDAISNRGFIGVKVYPPMGYLGYGNARHAGSGACPAIEDGDAIDIALGRLYAWCVENNVPVMSHTSHSFGRTDAHDGCATPHGWEVAIGAFEGLRVQAGHFGGGSDYAIRNEWAAAYARMAATPQGKNLYADLSNLDGLFVPDSALRKAMEPLYAKMVRRMAYGSDWYMTELQNAASTYAADMANYLGRIEDAGIPRLRERVFGLNAAALYGLSPTPIGERKTNWDRLVAYYDRQDIPKPRWMRKLGVA